MNDSELERIAASLGEKAAARLDVEGTAAAVVARLRSRGAPAWWSSPGLLRLAAAVTLTVGAGLFASRAVFHRVSGPHGEITTQAAPQLQPLSGDELEEVLDSLSADVPFQDAAVGLHSLNDDQLHELLQHLEG